MKLVRYSTPVKKAKMETQNKDIIIVFFV